MFRVDQRVLRWFGLVEGIHAYRMAMSMLMAEVSGRQVRGRQRLGLMNGWREGGPGQQRDEGRGCAKMRGR